MKYVIKPSPRKGMSSALLLISHVWNHNREATGHSWTRLNASMRDAVRLAIEAGMRFEKNDFIHIGEHYRPSYWMGEHMGEDLYALACRFDNLSACQSFEKWKERPPMILNGSRLYVGYRIDSVVNHHKNGELPEWFDFGSDVTSIAGESDPRAIVCSSDRKRRFKVTLKDIRETNAAIRQIKKSRGVEPAEAANG